MEKVIVIPVTDGVLSGHFGHCEQFYFAQVEDGKIVGERFLTPPAHEPGLYPRWVKEQGGQLVIAGGMGQRACGLFAENGVDVVVGANPAAPRSVVEDYLNNKLQVSGNSCDH